VSFKSESLLGQMGRADGPAGARSTAHAVAGGGTLLFLFLGCQRALPYRPRSRCLAVLAWPPRVVAVGIRPRRRRCNRMIRPACQGFLPAAGGARRSSSIWSQQRRGSPLVGYSDNVADCSSLPPGWLYRIDANQELLGAGVVNVGNGLLCRRFR